MGGKNIIIVMDDANLDLAVEGAVWGGFGTTGQRCTAASRVAVHKNVYGEFVKRFVERVKTLRVGDGLGSEGGDGAVHQRTAVEHGDELRGDRKERRREAADGREPLEQRRPCEGLVPRADRVWRLDAKMRVAQEEIFGPVVSVIPFDGFDEAISIANGVAYGLSASIYTKNVNQAFAAMRDLYTGIVYVNAPTIGAETHLPFGGTKQTGNGHREAAVAAIDFFTEWKTLYIDYSDKLQRAQIDNN